MKIIGYGKYVPSKVMSNKDFEKIIDTTDEWITTRTGIKKRHIAETETLCELAKYAAENALKDAKIDKEDIDMIIVATSTQDNIIPSCACEVGNKLGIKKDIMCFDLSAACTGFIYALDIANKYLSEEIKNILVIGAEKLSKVVDYEDRNTCILFGDGAGALVVTKDERKNITSYIKANGEKCDALTLKGVNCNKPSYIYMNGKEIFTFATRIIPEVVEKLIEKSNVKLDEIKYIVPHQANIRIIDAASKRLNVDNEKFFMNLKDYGNTSAASIVLALCDMKEKNLLKNNDKTILVGFGGGLTFGGILIEL